jgi:hypothetical protein
MMSCAAGAFKTVPTSYAVLKGAYMPQGGQSVRQAVKKKAKNAMRIPCKELLLTVGGFQRLFHHIDGGLRIGVHAAQTANGQHEHVELKHHFRIAVVDDASIAQNGKTIGTPLSFFARASHQIVNMFIGISHVQFLSGKFSTLLVVPGTFGKKASPEKDIGAIVMFEADIFHIPAPGSGHCAILPLNSILELLKQF